MDTDPSVAAQHLISQLESELLDRFLYQLLGEVTKTYIKKGTARAIEAFRQPTDLGAKADLSLRTRQRRSRTRTLNFLILEKDYVCRFLSLPC